MEFTKISKDAFEHIQVNAGVILKKFDVENPKLINEDIICTTTGGITVSTATTMGDWGEDIDNCPNKMKELAYIDNWDVSMSFTVVNMTEEMLKMSLGAADIDATTGKITPRRDLKQKDFIDSIWWVGDRTDGGCVVAQLLNALSTNGISLKSTKNSKGNLEVTLAGHFSINSQDVVPISFYIIGGEDMPSIGPGGGGIA